jgi:serine protease Do
MTLDIEKLGVFQVFTGGGTGSGFLIAPQLLLTNAHVVAPYREVAIERRDKTRMVGVVRRVHPKRDLAIVEITLAPGETLPPTEILSIAADVELGAKEEVHIIGFPRGLPLSVTEGVVSNPRQVFDGQIFVQTDAAINPGNSGGPMLNHDNEIVAVTSCKLSSADMVGFGIPSTDVSAFIAAFEQQTSAFGIVCPSCDTFHEASSRYCENCGVDLGELREYFEEQAPHPLRDFVERSLQKANINPVLARHGEQSWSFHSGSAPIRIWSCCSEHVCFGSTLAQTGKQRLGELLGFLLSTEHMPFSFDLTDNLIRFNYTVHMTDVFATSSREEIELRIGHFFREADRMDNILISNYACEPAPHTQLSFLNNAPHT